MSRSMSKGSSRKGKRGKTPKVAEPRLDMDDLESEGGTPRDDLEENGSLSMASLSLASLSQEEEKPMTLKTRMQLDIEAAAVSRPQLSPHHFTTRLPPIEPQIDPYIQASAIYLFFHLF